MKTVQRIRAAGPACRRCGCPRGGHLSYIPGGDKPGYCASCACHQYQPQRPWARLLAWVRQRPVPAPATVLRPRPVPYPVPGCAGDEDMTRLDIPIARPYAGTGREGRHARRPGAQR